MMSTKRGPKSREGRIVKHTNLKRVAIALLLASIGLGIFTIAYGYTYQAKTKLRLQDTIKALQVKDKLLDSKSKEAQDNAKKIEELTKQLQAKREAATALAEAKQVEQTRAVSPVRAAVAPSGDCSAWIAAAGINDVQSALKLIARESGCNPYAVNPSSGACGVGQALPCSKTGCAMGDGYCQVKWMHAYVLGRYGTWANALAHSYSHSWY